MLTSLSVQCWCIQECSEHFNQADEIFLQLIANLTASAIHNAQDYEDLSQLTRKQSEFISIASHELRTPLAPVPLYLQNLLKEWYGPLSARQANVITRVLGSVREERELIDDMLTLVRIQQGQLPAELVISPVVPLIFDTVNMFKMEANQKGVGLEVHVPKDGDKLWATLDEAMTKRVLRNLVSNAVKFTDKGKIVVRGANEGSVVRIDVRDTGIGIAEAQKGRIFDWFVRLSGRPGTGIGLSLVQEFIKKQGGTLSVESEEGRGSRFSFTLPASNDPNQEESDNESI